MANTKVTYFRTRSNKLSTVPVADGQIIFTVDTGRLYVDFVNTRVEISPPDPSTYIQDANSKYWYKLVAIEEAKTGIITNAVDQTPYEYDPNTGVFTPHI